MDGKLGPEEEIFELDQQQKDSKLQTIGRGSTGKITDIMKKAKAKIFEKVPDSFMRRVYTPMGSVTFSQTDAQEIGSRKVEMKIKNSVKMKRHLSSRDRKKLKLFVIPKDSLKYDEMLSLNALWKGYIKDLMESSQGLIPHSETLLKADFHGAIFTVVRSKTPSYVNIEGIMVQETENTFKILTKENIVKIVPKCGCVFSFPYEGGKNKKFEIQVFGDNFRYRSYERAAKKFKRKDKIDL